MNALRQGIVTPRSLLSKADSSALVAAVGVLDAFSRTLPSGIDHTMQLVVQGGLGVRWRCCCWRPDVLTNALRQASITPRSLLSRRTRVRWRCRRWRPDVPTNALRQHRSHHAACCQGGLECAGVAAVGVLDVLTNALRQASITPRSLLSKAD